MNLSDLHEHKAVSAKSISQSISSDAISIQILSNEILKEHISKVPALLICILGEVEYEDEKGSRISLYPGDLKEIEPMVKHKVKANKDSQLVLIK